MELHWLLLDPCIIFKLLLLVFISLHNLAPLCINEVLYRFSVEVVILDPQTYADSIFSVAAPKLWNALPINVRRSNTLSKRLVYLDKGFCT